MTKKVKCILLRTSEELLASIDEVSELLTGNRSETIRMAIIFYIKYFNSYERKKLMSINHERLKYFNGHITVPARDIKKELFQ